MPSRNRKKRSNKQQAEYLQKQDDILSRLKPERATRQKKASVRDSYKADPEKKKARQLQGRSRKEEGLCTRQLQRKCKQSAKKQRYQEDLEENRAAKRQRYQEDVEENRAAKGRNTRTIQLPLRHLKGIGIGMTPLSDWLNVLPRGSGIAGVTELPLPPKGMSWHVVH